MPSDDDLREMANDPSLSHWFKTSLIEALNRDPVDAANDAGMLAIVLDKRAAELVASASARAVIEQAARKQ